MRSWNIDKAVIKGSFAIEAYIPNPNKTTESDKNYIFVGAKSVLSRWHLTNCFNCQSHLKVQADFDILHIDFSHFELLKKENRPLFNIISHFGDSVNLILKENENFARIFEKSDFIRVMEVQDKTKFEFT